MDNPAPEMVIIAGPNGAGKSTFARFVLPVEMPFINADEIAKTLPQVQSNRDIAAGRLLLQRMDDLATAKRSFALETTLASRTLAPRITRLKQNGYRFTLIFLYLPDVEMAIARVFERVQRGGHDIPEDTIRRRYTAGLENLVNLYLPFADTWQIYANVMPAYPAQIAFRQMGQEPVIEEPELWSKITTR